MHRDEKYLARILFQQKVYQSIGNAFQALFWDVKSKEDNNFQRVRPYGNIGDRGNDGFSPSTGEYYQVYAPEELSIKEADAITKLNEDFEKLHKFWDQFSKIKTFYYVLNDKYKGIGPNLSTALLDLHKKNPGIEFKPFLTKELEDSFLGLNDDNIFSIIGLPPSPDKIETIDFSILTEVINHIFSNQKPYKLQEKLSNTEFFEKIQFNNLSEIVASLLNTANYQSGLIEEYFSLNSTFTKSELRNLLVETYQSGLQLYQAGNIENKNDLVFFHILESIGGELVKQKPEQEKNIQDAILVLMSYYFESCDIFETPMEEKE
jgi:hypothetical protein